MSPDDQAMLAELRRRGDPVSLRAVERFETYHRLDREAATHVEGVIAMRTGFTGDEPYVGWKGIGLALGEALNERDTLRVDRRKVEALAQPVWQLLDDMGADGRSVCGAAKAHARMAFEPFSDGAGDDVLDYKLHMAVATIIECEETHGKPSLLRDPTVLAELTEPALGEAAAHRLDLTPFDRLIAICAFRYALGRMTYMVEHVSSWLMASRERLSAHDRALIVREIDEAAEMKRLGMECDETRWMRCRAAMAGGGHGTVD